MSILSRISFRRGLRKRSASADAPRVISTGTQTDGIDLDAMYSKYVSDSDKYAVVYWYNYRKELHAGFLKNFNTFDEAERFALDKAEQDRRVYENDGPVITERQITDNNGPTRNGSPYAGRSIIGYGGRDSTGYATTFYCVVPWFDGVENNWSFDMDDSGMVPGQWYPKYYC